MPDIKNQEPERPEIPAPPDPMIERPEIKQPEIQRPEIGKVARKAAVLVAGGEKEAITVSAVQVPTHLGQPRFFDEVAER